MLAISYYRNSWLNRFFKQGLGNRLLCFELYHTSTHNHALNAVFLSLSPAAWTHRRPFISTAARTPRRPSASHLACCPLARPPCQAPITTPARPPRRLSVSPAARPPTSPDARPPRRPPACFAIRWVHAAGDRLRNTAFRAWLCVDVWYNSKQKQPYMMGK